ncbi:hypothetical protein Q3G72_003660 [Acer saccharum]|nr:hypothetical protein Q3G72_003660 [Acer saccharum]
MFCLDRIGVLAGRVITFVNEKNSSKKALRRLMDLNPNIKKSELKYKCLNVFAAKTLATEFLIKAANGTLYDDYEDEKAEAYLESVAERMGIRRHDNEDIEEEEEEDDEYDIPEFIPPFFEYREDEEKDEYDIPEFIPPYFRCCEDEEDEDEEGTNEEEDED